ncbi:2OG-Fe(II) oxygenase [Paracrocinitomix mangrovi]|uniref:2OG-Fe(II) oxygenase n=1 Tax=Paracrocinitomix mangrovi TaxID=2862509 RepID=UPI001C8E9CA4|nr:2OG-Fe(II) oxygenase [Paracrocinitomix mangrovi]UKN02347.1 2OG-Fe(II) oxygenase [Paracrocinitomix mangrovi]
MEQQYEQLIQILLEKGFGSVDGWFSDEEQLGLRKALLSRYNNDNFRHAGIGDKFNLTKVASIRSDKIHWLNVNTEIPAELSFFAKIEGFIQYLNRTCYAGINSHEFHYAVYEPGTFYQRHVDQFNADDRRKFSMVLYLNDEWIEGNGGELMIYKNGDHKIDPIPGRLVFFSSDIEHEVLQSNFQRKSLTGWLKTL